MLQLPSSDTNSLATSMLLGRETPPNSPGPANINNHKMLHCNQIHSNNLDGTSSRSQDLTGQYSPNISNNNSDNSKSMMNFGFTQEQVECVCEVNENYLNG